MHSIGTELQLKINCNEDLQNDLWSHNSRSTKAAVISSAYHVSSPAATNLRSSKSSLPRRDRVNCEGKQGRTNPTSAVGEKEEERNLLKIKLNCSRN